MNRNLSIVMYHYTRDLIHSRYPNIKGMELGKFRKQLEIFKANYNVVRMEDVIEAVKNDAKLPNNAMLLTFDDGYIDNYTYALPLLEEFGFQGSFFIPAKTFVEHKLLDVNKIHYILASADIDSLVTYVKIRLDYYRGREFDYPSTGDLWQQYAISNRFDNERTIFVKRVLQTAIPEIVRNRISSELFAKYVGITEEQLAYELYMTYDQIHTMKRHGMHIGIHGYDHYWLANLTHEEMINDISKAITSMRDFIDTEEWVMCYPYGNYNNHVLNVVQKQGGGIRINYASGCCRLRCG